MKKQSLLLALALSAALTACSAPAATNSNNSAEVESLEAQVQALQKENEDLKKQISAVPEETTAEETQAAANGTAVSVGDTLSLNNMEITINKAEFSYDVLPDDTSGFYTHYEADPGNVFIHIDADIKNTGKQNLSCDQILDAVADYNGGYTYTSQAIPEDATTGFTYANISTIKPLETAGMRFLIKCPQEVEETQNPLFITITPEGSKDSYILTMR